MRNETVMQLPWISRLVSSRNALLVRGLVFLIFGVVTYSAGYLKAVEANSFADTFGVVQNTIRAANEGHILMAYTPEVPSRLLPLNQISSGYYDPGWPMLVSLTASVGRSLTGGSFTVDNTTVYGIVWVFVLTTGMIFLLPIVPLLISIGGATALTLSMTALLPGYNAFGSLWGSTHSVIVMAVFVCTLGLARLGWRTLLVFAMAVGCLVGIGQFIRHEATLILYFSGAVIAGAAAIVDLFVRYLISDSGEWRATVGRFALQVIVGTIVSAGVVFAIPFGVRAIFAITFDQLYADTRIAMHGEGHSLYLSLGYISNPYNISWRDNVASIHSELIDADVRIDSPNYHQVLRDEWIRIVWESPWILLENMIAKANALQIQLLSLPVILVLFSLLPIVSISMVVITFVRPQLPGILILIGFLALLVVSLSIPLLIFPTYNQAFQGLLLSLLVAAPAVTQAAVGSSKSWYALTPDVNKKLRNVIGVLVVGAVILVLVLSMGFVAIQWDRRQIKVADALTSDPFALIQHLGFRYDNLFNSLDKADQQVIVERLKQIADSRVWATEYKVWKTADYFRPELLVFSDRQVHVLVWLGSPGPDFEFTDQGSASSFLRMCADCESFPPFLANNPYRLTEDQIAKDIQAINDADWYGHYRMMSFPLKSSKANPKFWCIGLQGLASLNLETYTYSLDTLASACFTANE